MSAGISCLILSWSSEFEQLLNLEVSVLLRQLTDLTTLCETRTGADPIFHEDTWNLSCFCHTQLSNVYGTRCMNFCCSVLHVLFWVCEEMWKARYLAVRIPPAGSSSHLLYNKLLERCHCHTWHECALNQWALLARATRERTPLTACRHHALDEIVFIDVYL